MHCTQSSSDLTKQSDDNNTNLTNASKKKKAQNGHGDAETSLQNPPGNMDSFPDVLDEYDLTRWSPLEDEEEDVLLEELRELDDVELIESKPLFIADRTEQEVNRMLFHLETDSENKWRGENHTIKAVIFVTARSNSFIQ